MLETVFGATDMTRTQVFEWFSVFRHGDNLVEDHECSVVHPQVTQMETWSKFAKPSIKTDKVPL
jgi:hypothetical protein